MNVSLTAFVDKILHRTHYDKFARPGLDFGEWFWCPKYYNSAKDWTHCIFVTEMYVEQNINVANIDLQLTEIKPLSFWIQEAKIGKAGIKLLSSWIQENDRALIVLTRWSSKIKYRTK